MEKIGVREIRQNASEYLRRVGLGERICVTSRGRPVAVLVPFGEVLAESVGSILEQLVEAGVFATMSDAVDAGADEFARPIKRKLLDEAVVAGYRRIPEAPGHWLDEVTVQVLAEVE